MQNKKNIFIHALSLLILCIGFALLRFVLLDIHHLAAWSEVLFFSGLIVLVISFFRQGNMAPFCTAFAYSLAFIPGYLFQTDGVDPGGGTTNNLWVTWTGVFLGLVVIGVIADMIAHFKRK